jgi:hypothetical protein
MRYRREQNHHDTSERPDIELYVDQLYVVPVNADEETHWTLNLMTIESDAGDVGGNAVAQGASAERYIPGIMAGHLYKITLSAISSLEDIVMTLGGTHVYTLSSGSNKTNHVVHVRPAGNLLKFNHPNVGNFTGAVTAFSIEALDPIDLDRMMIKEFGT